MIKLIILFVFSVCITSAHANVQHPLTNHPKHHQDFDNYVEGALEVYSQFKTPSKKESEEFYKFIREKWVYVECSNNCSKYGYLVGNEYAEKKNVQIKKK